MSPVKSDDVSEKMGSLSLENEQVTAKEVELPKQAVNKPDYLQCPINWIQFLKCGVHMGNPSTKKYILEWVAVHDKRQDYVLRTTPIEYFLKKILQAVFKLDEEEDGAPKEALIMLDKLVKLAMKLDEARFSNEYKEGLVNLIVCTKHEVMLSHGVMSGPGSCKTLPPRKLDDLSPAAKCPILAAKVYFCKVAKGTLAFQERLVRQILGFEKEWAEWYHLHHSVLRAIRHQDEVRFHFRPDAFELSALEKAYTLDNENLEILASIWKTLFDCFKQKRDFFVQIGSLEFSCREAIAEYLCSSIMKAVDEGNENSVRVLLAAAQIIGFHRIPEEKRSIDLTEMLLDKALELWPTNSKIMCRIGTFQMFEKKNVEDAKARFLLAMTEDPSDAVSTLNYFWIDSAKGKEENIAKIEETLACKGSCQWPDHVRLDLGFLKGMIYLSVGKTKDALKEWTQAQELSYKYFMTKLFSTDSTLRRYHWKVQNEDGEEEPMNSEFIEVGVTKFYEAAAGDDTQEDSLRVVEVFKTVKLARTRPPREDQDGQEPRARRENDDGKEWKPRRDKQDGQEWRSRRGDDQNGQEPRARRENDEGKEWKPRRDKQDGQEWRSRRGDDQNERGSRPPRENKDDKEWRPRRRDNQDQSETSRNGNQNRDWRKSEGKINEDGEATPKINTGDEIDKVDSTDAAAADPEW